MPTDASRTVSCPECQRRLVITTLTDGSVLVEVHGITQAAACCQAFATEKHAKVGRFVTDGKTD